MSDDLTYFAGFFDGEGCIFIGKEKDTKSLRLIISVTNTNLRILESFKFQFGGDVRRSKPRENRKSSWIWRVSCRQAYSFLISIFPYLRIKKLEAEIAINFSENKSKRHFQAHGGKQKLGLTDEQIILENKQSMLLKNIKRGG